MKKFALSIAASVVLLAALCMQPFPVLAAETVSVQIPVEIEGGGTAIVISEVNCPLPEASSLEVANGMTENIYITFSEAGVYSYTIQAEEKDNLYYSPVYYTAEVAVKETPRGTLDAVTVLTKAGSDYKPDVCSFVRADTPSSTPTLPVATDSAVPTQPSKNPPTSRPKTGDDSMLDVYLLICIAAASGLFGLSIVYSVSTSRLIGEKNNVCICAHRNITFYIYFMIETERRVCV